jgi:hypothetical protein
LCGACHPWGIPSDSSYSQYGTHSSWGTPPIPPTLPAALPAAPPVVIPVAPPAAVPAAPPAMVPVASHVPHVAPLGICAELLKLDPIKKAKAFLDSLEQIQFYLHMPEFSTGHVMHP